MKVLVTGAKGFVGKNLVAALNNLLSGKDRTHPELTVSGSWNMIWIQILLCWKPTALRQTLCLIWRV